MRLGTPNIPVNSSGAYLRQRVAARREWEARRRGVWRWRLVKVALCVLLYFLIGRDLVGVVLAVGRAESACLRKDAQILAKDVQKLMKAKRDRAQAAPAAPISAEQDDEALHTTSGPARQPADGE